MTQNYIPDIHLLLSKGVPFFANEKLVFFDELLYRELLWQKIERSSVDLAKVLGTTHSDYAGHSWLELLPTDYRSYEDPDFDKAERMGFQGRLHRGWERLKELHLNPEYYLNCKTKQHMSFYKLGDSYYIDEGNHRTVLSRFFLSLNDLPQKLRGVTIKNIVRDK